ncbi:MAG: GntR family transcriptional regulator [Synergistota bacterium]|nr:GntR family transcriptional regulator [Synergistota bacterium]
MENSEDRAYRLIINEILSGVYAPGEFLLELDLAPKLKMSRTPVSRALSRLVSEGFLNKIPKKGCYVPIPTPKDAQLVFKAREFAEGEAAALAAEYATEKEISILENIIARDKAAFESNDKIEWAQINEDLHLSIARFSHNPYIEKWVHNIFWRSNVYVFFFDGFYKPTEIAIEHETPKQHVSLVDAIRRRNADDARSIMRSHVFTTFSKLLILPM